MHAAVSIELLFNFIRLADQRVQSTCGCPIGDELARRHDAFERSLQPILSYPQPQVRPATLPSVYDIQLWY